MPGLHQDGGSQLYVEVTRAEGVFLLLTTLVGQRWPENTKNYFWDPQMQLSFTNLVSTDIFIPVQAEQRVALHLPEQRLSFKG